MEESVNVEHIDEHGLTRSDLIKRAAVAGVGISALGALTAGTASAKSGGADTVRWVSPRGTLEVMDDYNLIIPTVMGYYKTLNINVKLFPGDASGNLPQVAAKQYDMGYASPGVLTSSVEAGVPVTSIWEMIPSQVFDFVLPAGSKIKNPRQMRGKTIAVYNIGWKSIVDPMLAEVGINPKTVKYREFGPQWNQAVALKLADAGLSWEGLRAQLEGTAAFFGSGNAGLEFLVGSQWGSKGPSNTYQVRTADLDDAHLVDVYTRLLTGSVMGFEFCRVNPRAAAQIVYEQYPAMQNVIAPQVAVNSLMQLASLYSTSRRKAPHQWGYHYPAAWGTYLNTVFKLGQTKTHVPVANVLTNRFVSPANASANKARARRDAAKFKLSAAFKKTVIPKGYPL